MSTCTLGQGPFPLIEHPGPVVGFVYGDFLLPRWAGEHLRIAAAEHGRPEPVLTPVYPYREDA